MPRNWSRLSRAACGRKPYFARPCSLRYSQENVLLGPRLSERRMAPPMYCKFYDRVDVPGNYDHSRALRTKLVVSWRPTVQLVHPCFYCFIDIASSNLAVCCLALEATSCKCAACRLHQHCRPRAIVLISYSGNRSLDSEFPRGNLFN